MSEQELARTTLDVYSHLWPDSTRTAVDARSAVSDSCPVASGQTGNASSDGLLTVSRPVGGILSTLFRGMGGHPSERSTWGWQPESCRTGSPCPLFDLAPGGVYRADRVTPAAGALLPHRFTLACAQP